MRVVLRGGGARVTQSHCVTARERREIKVLRVQLTLRTARRIPAGESASDLSRKALPCGLSGSETNRSAATEARALRLAAMARSLNFRG